jgi:hypothetical protein
LKMPNLVSKILQICAFSLVLECMHIILPTGLEGLRETARW